MGIRPGQGIILCCIVLVRHDYYLIKVDLRDVCVGRRVDMLGWYNGDFNERVGIGMCCCNKQKYILKYLY